MPLPGQGATGAEQPEDERLPEGNSRCVRDPKDAHLPHRPPYLRHHNYTEQRGADRDGQPDAGAPQPEKGIFCRLKY